MNDKGLTIDKSYQLLRKSALWLLVFSFFLACNTNHRADQQVFITDTGSKYHLEHCRYLKYSRKVISLKEAEEKGYGPCKVCKPKDPQTDQKPIINAPTKASIPAKPLQYAIRCSHKNAGGIQCKRMTKNAGGKCWQHK